MNPLARIAQMESSRIVGGRAQTQALLRAPVKTSRTDATGICHPSGSHGVTQYYANSIPLPSGSISRIEPAFERGHVSQALLDISALLVALLIGLSVLLSVPLSIFLLLFATF